MCTCTHLSILQCTGVCDQAKVDKTFVDRARWTKMSIMSTAGSGMFSSDRTTREYAEEIWGIQPVERFWVFMHLSFFLFSTLHLMLDSSYDMCSCFVSLVYTVLSMIARRMCKQHVFHPKCIMQAAQIWIFVIAISVEGIRFWNLPSGEIRHVSTSKFIPVRYLGWPFNNGKFQSICLTFKKVPMVYVS